MRNHNQQLHTVWDEHAKQVATIETHIPKYKLDELMASLFCSGPHYYYIVDFTNREIKHITPSVEDVLGFKPETVTFNDIIDSIHPDDVAYVMLAEDAVLNHLYQHIGGDKAKQYKMSYCFRFKTADGSYQLFQHQAVLLTTDEQGSYALSLNVHTNINHLTTENNYKATLTGIFGEKGFWQTDLKNKMIRSVPEVVFSLRELEIIRLIARGLNYTALADALFISPHTVKTHRKNILHKAGVSNSAELINFCMLKGIL